MLQVLPNKYIWETVSDFDGDVQTLLRTDIQAAAAMAGTTSAVGAADFGRPIDGATLDKLLDWNITIWYQFDGVGNWQLMTQGNLGGVLVEINTGTGDFTFTFGGQSGFTHNVRVVLIG